MRRSILIFLIINFAIIVFLVHSVFTLLTLLMETGDADQIYRAEIPPANSPLPKGQLQLIPKIIHQTYINESIPEGWKEAHQQCRDLHQDYEHKLWTDAMSREFIANEYPWFLDIFDGYPYPIQRADAIRYFILVHYGGIYIDLDDGCNRRLDPLLSYPAWLHRTLPTGISNDAMGSIPRHPFFLQVIEALPGYNRNWILPYVTVMYSTGPLFLSVIWKQYMNSGKNVGDGKDGGRVRIIMPDEYSKKPSSFFNQFVGSSWHNKDARLIFWAGDHWLFLTITGFLIAGVVAIALWWIWGRIWGFGPGPRRRRWSFPWRTSRREDYEKLEGHET